MEHRQMCITMGSVSSLPDLRMILALCSLQESGLSDLGKGRAWVRNKCISEAYSHSRKPKQVLGQLCCGRALLGS